MNGNTTFGETMKQCTRCLESFPITLEFFPKTKTSLGSQCRKCIAEKSKIYFEKNKEIVLEKNKNYRKNNPEKMNNYKKKWLLNNPEKRKESRIKWDKNNPDLIRAFTRRNNHKRRARKQDSVCEPYTETQVLAMYGTKCHICNLEIDMKAARKAGKKGWENGLHIDHLIALANGGADTLENVRPAHGLCNIKKGAKETATAVPQLERAMIEKIEKR